MAQSQEGRVGFTSKGILLSIALISSMVRVWVATLLGMGMIVALFEFFGNLLFGLIFLKKERVGQAGLIVLAIINLLYFGLRALLVGELFLGLYEGCVSLVLLIMLVGAPSTARIWSGAGLYFLFTLGALGSQFLLARHGEVEMNTIAADAVKVDEFQSKHLYGVTLKGLPWRILTPEQADALFGIDAQEVDLRLVRLDGSAFALYFPIQFGNVPFHPALAEELEREIRGNWFASLTDWQRIEAPDGFLLAASGENEGEALSYVVFYKHFGNFGVYALLWSHGAHRARLLKEGEALYSATIAPPIKQRLPKVTPNEIHAQNGPAQVTLTVYDSKQMPITTLSGFNLSPLGLIVTNLVPLLQEGDVTISFPDGRVFNEISIVAISRPEADLAILNISGDNLPTIAALKTVEVASGDSVYHLANPQTGSATKNEITAIRVDGPLTLYDLSQPATSGSPIFNEFGEAVAISKGGEAGGTPTSLTLDEFSNLFLLPTPIPLEDLRLMLRG